MSRRHTVNSDKSSANDYPEHLNPFHDEENEDEGHKVNNKFNTVGRRNSRLTASFRMRSWSMFSSKNSKTTDQNDEEKDTTVSPKSSRTKFSTLTPKISRQLLEALSPKKNKKKLIITSNSPYTSTPTETPATDFKITPKTSRETYLTAMEEKQKSTAEYKTEINPDSEKNRFMNTSTDTNNEPRAMPSQSPTLEKDTLNTDLSTTPKLFIKENVDPQEKSENQRPKPESRIVQPPVPLPRTIVPTTLRSKYCITEEEEQPSTSTAEVSRRQQVRNKSAEVKYITQGAKPKKKRQAPLPPSIPPTIGPSSDTSPSAEASVSSTPEPTPQIDIILPTPVVEAEVLITQ